MARLNSSIISAITGATAFLDSAKARELGVNDAFLNAIEKSETQKQGAALTAGAAEDAWKAWRNATILAVKAGADPDTVGVIVDIKVGDNKLRQESVKVYRSTVIGLAGVYRDTMGTEGALKALASDAGLKLKENASEAEFAENLGRSAATKLIKARKMRSRITPADRLRALKAAIGKGLDAIRADYNEDLKGTELAEAKAKAVNEAIGWAEELAGMLGDYVDLSTVPAVTSDSEEAEGDDDSNVELSNPMDDDEAEGVQAADSGDRRAA